LSVKTVGVRALNGRHEKEAGAGRRVACIAGTRIACNFASLFGSPRDRAALCMPGMRFAARSAGLINRATKCRSRTRTGTRGDDR
jgi:hypothetical protein